MSRAYITLRSENHLSMRLNLDILELLEGIYKNQKKVFDFNSFANLSDEKLKLEFEAIKSKIQEIDIKVDNISLKSPYFRFAKFNNFKKRVKREFMNRVLDKHSKKEHKASIDNLTILDGFIPKNAKTKVLSINFPKEFGNILVTFAKPKTKVIKPDENSSKYQLLFD